jgi:hypothetical protein
LRGKPTRSRVDPSRPALRVGGGAPFPRILLGRGIKIEEEEEEFFNHYKNDLKRHAQRSREV